MGTMQQASLPLSANNAEKMTGKAIVNSKN